MAQQVEHVLGKDGVTGSNPVSSSTKNTLLIIGSVFFCYAGVRQLCCLGSCSIKKAPLVMIGAFLFFGIVEFATLS